MKNFSLKKVLVALILLLSITYSLPTFFSETPTWLTTLNAKKMNLGLDLKGGVHFLMEVDLVEVVNNKSKKLSSDMRSQLRKEKIRYKNFTSESINITIDFLNYEDYKKADKLINRVYQNTFDVIRVDDSKMKLEISEKALNEIRIAAIKQNT